MCALITNQLQHYINFPKINIIYMSEIFGFIKKNLNNLNFFYIYLKLTDK